MYAMYSMYPIYSSSNLPVVVTLLFVPDGWVYILPILPGYFCRLKCYLPKVCTYSTRVGIIPTLKVFNQEPEPWKLPTS